MEEDQKMEDVNAHLGVLDGGDPDEDPDSTEDDDEDSDAPESSDDGGDSRCNIL